MRNTTRAWVGSVAVALALGASLTGCSGGSTGGASDAGIQSGASLGPSSGGGGVAAARQAGSVAAPEAGSVAAPQAGGVANGSTKGELRILIHDAPTPAVDQVWVTFDQVSVHSVSAGWIVISSATQEIDLLALQGGVVATLGLGSLPVGDYTQIRLRVASARVVLPSGQSEPLKIPSGGSSGLKIVHGFSVVSNGRLTLTLDWDVGAHLKHNKGQGWTLRPTLVVESEVLTGIVDTGALDLNGDGQPDFMVAGSPPVAMSNHHVLAYFGDGGRLPTNPQQELVVPPPSGPHGLGSGLNLGDINGDGYSDVLFRRDFDDQGLHVFLGSPTGVSPTRFQHLANPNGPLPRAALGARFGGNPSVGDVDGDGVRDLATSGNGTVWILKGRASGGFDPIPVATLLNPDNPGSLSFVFGLSLGDVNGDGHADLVVSNAQAGTFPNFRGRIWVYFGSPTWIAQTPSLTIDGPTTNDRFGYRIEASEDYNGDGADDLVVGAPFGGAAGRGRVFVFPGSATGPTSPPLIIEDPDPATLFNVGESSRSVGDFTGNGFPDLAVCARGIGPVGNGPGAALIYEGGPAGLSLTPVARLNADPPGPGVTSGRWIPQVVGVGDLNGDGSNEVALLTESVGLNPVRVYASGNLGTQNTPDHLLAPNVIGVPNSTALGPWLLGYEAAVAK